MGAEGPRLPDRLSSSEVALSRNAKIADHLRSLCTSPLFGGLRKTDCIEIAEYGFACTFAKNEFLFVQGHPVDHLILIKSGVVKLTQLSSQRHEVLLWI